MNMWQAIKESFTRSPEGEFLKLIERNKSTKEVLDWPTQERLHPETEHAFIDSIVHVNEQIKEKVAAAPETEEMMLKRLLQSQDDLVESLQTFLKTAPEARKEHFASKLERLRVAAALTQSKLRSLKAQPF